MMMKKSVAFLTAIVIILSFYVNVFAESNMKDIISKNAIDYSIAKLERYDIVRNAKDKWSASDFITRRNAFELSHIVKCRNRDIMYKYDLSVAQKEGVTIDKYVLEKYKNYTNKFIDIDIGTYDFYLSYELWADNLLNGKETENGIYADFNSFTTYDEALAIMGKLLCDEQIYFNIVENYDEHPYYYFAKDVGLINSTNPLDETSLRISTDKLNAPITAYEFLNMLYCSMYIITYDYYDYGVPNNIRYVDFFVEEETIPGNDIDV